MQPLNYTPAAIEAISFIGDQLELKMPAYDGLEHLVAQWLSRAVVFQLPDNGRLFSERDYRPELVDLVRLPFPVMAAEFQADQTLYAEASGLTRADKRIALAFDPAALPAEEKSALCLLTENDDWLTTPAGAIAFLALYSPKELVIPDKRATWNFAPGLLLWDPATDLPTETAGTPADLPDWARPRHLTQHSLPLSVYGFRGRGRLLGMSTEHLHAATLNDSVDEMASAWELMAALGCKNVRVSELPAPAALNKKREKTGRPALRAVRFLDIQLAPPSEAASRTGGGHASPRPHLRRGHIRRLPATESREARAIWVNAALVKGGAPQAAPYRVRP